MNSKRRSSSLKVISSLMFLFLYFFSSSYAFNSSYVLDSKGNDPWISFLHDSGNSGCSTTKIGLEPFSLEKLDYVGSKLFYGAAVYNDIIYVSAINYEEEYSEVIAFTLQDLKQIWRTVLDRKFASTSPVINELDKKIYIPCTDGYNIRGQSSSLIYSLEMQNGDIDWIREVDGAVFGPLLYHNGLLFYQNFYCASTDPGTTSESGDIGCINTSNGTVKWIKRMAYSFLQGSTSNLFPTILGDQILVPNTYLKFKENEKMEVGQTCIFYSFNLQSGNITKEIIKKECLLPALSVDKSSYYLTYTEIDGNTTIQKLEAFALDGTQKWLFTLKDSIGYCSAPIFNSKFVFLRNRYGEIYCINKETGKTVWHGASELSFPSGDGSGYAVNDQFVVSSFLKDKNSQIMIMDLSSSKLNIVWEAQIPDLIFQNILYGGKMIFIGINNIYIYQGEMAEIFINPNKIDASVYEKEKTSVTIQVSNKGKGKLVGSFNSDETWIKIPQKIFENNKTVNITLDASDLSKGIHTGRIDIISNAGNYNIPVTLNVLKEDLTPPDIIISFPEDYYNTTDSELLIQGRVVDEESGIQKLLVNNEEVLFDKDGYFEKKVTLSIGCNAIEIFAVNNVEMSFLKTITVIRKLPDTTGPVITITSPNSDYYTNIPRIDIKGRVVDEESDITSLTINQQPVSILENGLFESKDHLLKEGGNLFNIEAMNSANLSSSTSILVTLDTTPPDITMLYPETDMIVNKENVLISCLIEDKGSQIDKVFINNQRVTINEDDIAEMRIELEEGNNKIVVRATDIVGNTNITTRSIFLDMQAPTIEILSKVDPLETLYISSYELRFQVDDIGAGIESIVLTDQEGKKIDLEQDKMLYKTFLSLHKGKNMFHLTVMDKSSNKTEESLFLFYQPATVITLVIGQSTAFVQKNQEIKEFKLQAHPEIRKGITFVPIRFIVESFEAKVNWIPHPTNEIQIEYKGTLIHLWIGKSFGVIESGAETKKVSLLAPPFIKNSITMVPVRFLSENMGAKVEWDAKTSTIRIIHKIEE